jgi:HPr kinase/phosphorylase
MNKNITIHGAFLNIFNIGTLITGKSGIGKSELALALIERKHQLISDDAAVFRHQNQKIIGHASKNFKQFILVRGIGIINIVALFGENVIKEFHPLQLIIDLKKVRSSKALHADQSLKSHYTEKSILGMMIPSITLPFFTYNNLPLLVEIIVKNYLLKINLGYDAYSEFEKIQRQQIGNTAS